MSKPTKQELEIALEQAKHLRESGQDTHYMGKTLLNLHYQNSYLEQVLNAVERYELSGHDEMEHSHLLKAIDKARELDDYTSHRENPDPDLGL